MSLELALAAWRHWDVPSPLQDEPEVVGQLQWGDGNHAVKVQGITAAGPMHFVVRFLSRNALALGPDFDMEERLMRLAAGHGLAPELRYVRTDLKLLVMDYIEPAQHAGAVDAHALAELLNQIHALPVLEQPMDMQAQLRHYTALAVERGVSIDDLVDPLFPPLERAFAALQQDKPVVCHNDLHHGNVLQGKHALVAIDWEYAGVGSAYFDLVAAVEGWPDINQDTLVRMTLKTAFSPQRWQCARAVHAAIEWNWYQASGRVLQTRWTRESVTERLLALQ